MALAPISSSSSAQNAYGLDFQSLMQIILTQLTYQDPLKPVDNFQFVSQLGQFAQLQQSQTLNDQVTSLLAAQAATQAASLLGRTVNAELGGSSFTGVVQSVSFTTGQPMVTIRTADNQVLPPVSIANISNIRL